MGFTVKALGASLLIAALLATFATAAPAEPPPQSESYAGLEMTIADSADPVAVGEKLTYTASIRNSGPDPAVNLSFWTRLSDEAELVSVSLPEGPGEGCTRYPTYHGVSCRFDGLGVGETATIKLVVRPIHYPHLSLVFFGWAENGPEITHEISEHTTVFREPYMKRCTIFGTEDSDIFDESIHGTPGDDVICALGGASDEVYGGDGDDVIYGAEGFDNLYGEAGNDVIYGGIEHDDIVGGIGKDRLFGDRGTDYITTRDGVKGNDKANGGPGSDFITADRGDRVKE